MKVDYLIECADWDPIRDLDSLDNQQDEIEKTLDYISSHFSLVSTPFVSELRRNLPDGISLADL
jgi:hypothetical protein